MRSILKPTLVLMGGRCVAFAATFLIPVILVRTFDQASFGTYKQVFLIYSTLFVIAQFGMAESLYYFLPGNSPNGGKLTLNALLTLACSGILCAAILTAGASVFARWVGNPAVAAFLPALGVYLALTLVGVSLEISMVAEKRFLLAACSFAISESVRAAMFVLPAVVTGKLQWLLIGAVIFGMVRVIATGTFLSRRYPGALKPDVSLLRGQFAYVLPFELAILVDTLQLNFHQYAVSYHFDAATFAIYSIGCLQIPASEFLAGPAANVMMVRMTEELREGEPRNAFAVWDDTVRKLILLLIPLTGILVVSGRDLIVLLFTNAYLASVPIFSLWAMATALQTLPTDAAMRVYADTRMILAMNVVRFLFVVLTIGYALNRFGLIGPVLVTIGAAMLAKGMALVRIAKLLKVRFLHVVDWKLAGFVSVSTALAGTFASLGRDRFHTSAIAGLAISTFIFSVTCSALLLGLWLWKTRVTKTCAELPESSV
jgi:O-antigen/teichoic acid export membrane protein